MAKRSVCIYCGLRKAKRVCPALDGKICSMCCGQHRIADIDCPDCTYLSNETYQLERRQNQELAEAMHTVNPDVVGKDVFAASEAASQFTVSLERTFGLSYVESDLKDSDVKDALKAVYYRVFKEEEYTSRSDFSNVIVDYVKTNLIPEFQGSLSSQVQEKIILRLLLSIRNMSGGTMGDCGYLNYVKNNILSTPPDDGFVVETATGKKLNVNPDG